jgi:hypothetical protein
VPPVDACVVPPLDACVVPPLDACVVPPLDACVVPPLDACVAPPVATIVPPEATGGEMIELLFWPQAKLAYAATRDVQITVRALRTA